ncbi:hypothetical protein [Salipiger mucosus]|uniref:hypothetical protein n=1 Tax=Salipiger mucosus TaxID=263378 RepID=UPI0003678A51
MILREWLLPDAVLDWALIPSLLGLVALLSLQVGWGRRAFVATAIVLTVALFLREPDWSEVVLRAIHSSAFIAAFFAALATLRSAAEKAPAIRDAGTFLSKQPPGRRYAALTVGGQMFALLLNYGAIALLGSLATASARAEPDAEIRFHRTRRMLLAIQRAFCSTLPWSPLSFAVAITTALIPGTNWGGVLLPALGTSALMAVTGWSLDSIFKPRLSHPPPERRKPEGSWALMLPLAGLLAILVASTLTLQWLSGLRVIAIVLLVVPTIALVWLTLQTRSAAGLGRRLAGFAFDELPGYRGEVTLLMMAGYIGTVGAPLLQPLVAGLGLHPEALPTWLVLVGLVWLIPALGQLGMNPILGVTLLAPLIPSAEMLGVAPTAIVTAITAGWALGGISSPFTATTLLTGSFGNVSARHVGLVWNAGYMVAMLAILSLWVLVVAWLLG